MPLLPRFTRRSRRVVTAAACAGIAVTGLAGSKALMEHQARAGLAAIGWQGRVVADPLSGRVTLHSLRGDALGAIIDIGEVRLQSAALIPAALAGQDVTLTDVKLNFGDVSVGAPKIQVSGSSLDQAQLSRLLDQKDPRSFAARLADFKASAILIPQLAVSTPVGVQQINNIYRDVQIIDLAQGRCAELSSSGTTFQIEDPAGQISGEFGKMTARDMDFIALSQFYGAEQAGPAGETKLAYSYFSGEAFKVSGPMGISYSIDHISGKNYRLRSLGRSWNDLFATIDRPPDLRTASPAERARFVNTILDMYTVAHIGEMEITGIDFRAPNSPSPGGAHIARIAYVDAATGGDTTIEGFEILAPDTSIKIGSVAFKDWSWEPTVAAMRATLGNPAWDMDEFDARAFIPIIGQLALRDLNIDIPNRSARAQNPQAPNIKLSLQSFQAKADHWLHGIPTALRLGLDHFVLPAPKDTQTEGINALLAMGYDTLDLSFGFDGRWDEAANVVKLPEIFVSGAGMGRAALAGELGNIPKEVFTGDLDEARLTLLGANLKSVSLNLYNLGLAERLLEAEAKKQGKTPEQLRKELSAAASVLVPSMLSGLPEAKAIGAAVTAFLKKPGRLNITAKAKPAEGVGLSDYLAAGSPEALLEKFDITAAAN